MESDIISAYHKHMSRSQTSQWTMPAQNDVEECPICLDKFNASNHIVFETTCSHRMHNDCLENWKKPTCPLCRANIEDDKMAVFAFKACALTPNSVARFSKKVKENYHTRCRSSPPKSRKRRGRTSRRRTRRNQHLLDEQLLEVQRRLLRDPFYVDLFEESDQDIKTAVTQIIRSLDLNPTMKNNDGTTPRRSSRGSPESLPKNLSAATLDNWKFDENNDLDKTNFNYANMRTVEFSQMAINDSTFQYTDLTGAKIIECELGDVDMTGANLTDAILTGTYISGDLTDVNLTNADLKGTNLSEVTSFAGANLSNIRYNKETQFPELDILRQANHVPNALMR